MIINIQPCKKGEIWINTTFIKIHKCKTCVKFPFEYLLSISNIKPRLKCSKSINEKKV